MTPIQIVTGSLLLAWAAALGSPPLLPDEPDSVHLLAVFPEFKGKATELADLRHYRQQLEGYREGTLEVYNQAIEAYGESLKEFSGKLEQQKASGELAPEEYARLAELHEQGLRRCRKTGKFMQTYQSALGKYRAEHKWVIDEMLRLLPPAGVAGR